MDFGEKIAKRAGELRMDLKELARMVGIPYSTFRRQLSPKAKKRPTAPQGIALAGVLGVPVQWLFDDSADWPPPDPWQTAPPQPIYPWPPQGITWPEVQLAIVTYLRDKHMRGLVVNERTAPPEWVESVRALLDRFIQIQNDPAIDWSISKAEADELMERLRRIAEGQKDKKPPA